ncbi:MAG: hypothetical protein SX243_02440 [Acidobacteriota bacterium]|nr:hypothetical protein [Acidobacteriota bacterium]
MKKLIPTRTQWNKWHLPSKATYIGCIAGVLGPAISLVLFLTGSCPNDSARNSRMGKANFDKLDEASGPQDRDLRISYLRLDGLLLLDRALKGYAFSEKEGFLFEPYWLKNDIFKDLEEVIRYTIKGATKMRGGISAHAPEHRLPYDAMNVFMGNKGEEEFFKDIPGVVDRDEWRRLREPLFGSLRPLRAGPLIKNVEASTLEKRLLDSPYWTIAPDDRAQILKQPLRPFDFYFLGTLSPEEATQYLNDPLTRALLSVDSPPKDLFLARFSESWGTYSGHILQREVSLLSLDIENVSDQPVAIERLLSRSISRKAFTLTSPEEQTDAFEASDPDPQKVPLEELLPGEHLLVPLQIEFRLGSNGRYGDRGAENILLERDLPQRWWAEYPGDAVGIQFLLGIDQNREAILKSREVSKELLDQKAFFKNITDSYILGSSWRVDHIVASFGKARSSLSVRRFDPTNVLVRGGFAKGSCPILYATKNAKRVRLRPVFPEAVTRTFQMTDSITLPLGVTEFTLSEEEDEVSFLDYLAICTDCSQPTDSAVPLSELSELHRIDGHYLTLRKGEEVTFQVPKDLALPEDGKSGHTLLISGYYIPYNLMPDIKPQ